MALSRSERCCLVVVRSHHVLVTVALLKSPTRPTLVFSADSVFLAQTLAANAVIWVDHASVVRFLVWLQLAARSTLHVCSSPLAKEKKAA